jgi:hypothetical protein
VNSQSCLLFALALSVIAFESAATTPAAQSAKPAAGDTRCPLKAADLDALTPYHWEVAQYQADRTFIPDGSIRIDFCELIGKDDRGGMRTGVTVNIARGAHAEAFAKHWRAACANSLMPDARGKVQPVADVPGGQQCVTPNGSSSLYWIESPGRTLHIDPADDAVAKIIPRIMAAAAR